MTIVCPSCNGLGYRPGQLLDREAPEQRRFEAVECPACTGRGVQWLMDPVGAQPVPIMPTWRP